MRSPLRSIGASLGAALLLAACQVLSKDAPVNFATDPPGARVVLDGRDSGFVTPCLIALDPFGDLRLDLVYPGYQTATRHLTADHKAYAILWREMYIRAPVWHFPLFLNTADFFVPVKYYKTLTPGRIYVRLERAADA